MQVTVVVLNYNYSRFVADAIESALGQTYRDLEVVVVDNGSTDDSLQVIQPYTDRVRLVRQPVNIGQGQGYNLGFEAAQGEWIIWLDADDLLAEDAIATCMAMAQPDTAKVQFPLWLVDAEARRLGGVTPFLRHHGDVAQIIRRFGHYAGPPGSGNLYRRAAIAPYFPVPPQDWPICTDTVPFVTAPFHGKVVDTGRPLGYYRLHKKPSKDAPGYRGNVSVSMGTEVRLNNDSRDRTLALLRDRSGIDLPGPFLTLPPLLRHRIISWRLDRANHPCPGDNAANLRRQMDDALRECPSYTALERTLMRAWTLGVLYLPMRMAVALMSSSHDTPLWGHLLRWTRRFSS